MNSFNEEKDDIDAYIRRFEKYATDARWDQNSFALYLGSLLQGKSLEVYSRMPSADANNYEKLKQALLKHYHMTEEGFRKKFHGVRMSKGETVSQFMSKLMDYFDRWLELAEVRPRYDDLHDFIVKEQFLHACPSEVSIHIREKEVKTIADVVHAAEVYMDAHKLNFGSAKPESEKKSANHHPHKLLTSGDKIPEVKKSDDNPDSRSQNFPDVKTCWLCKKKGHVAFKCPLKEKAIGSVLVEDSYSTEDEDEVDCQSVSTAFLLNDTHQCSPNLRRKQKCQRIPTLSGGGLLKEDKKVLRNLPTCRGTVNNKDVVVLRDTGCSLAVVKKSLVEPEQFTGKTGYYISVDKTSRPAPYAEVYVKSPTYTGVIKALCLEDPLCDVIIGNLPQVVQQPGDVLYRKPDSSSQDHSDKAKVGLKSTKSVSKATIKSIEMQDNSLVKLPGLTEVNKKSVQDPEVKQSVQAVVTRQQATMARQKRTKPLKVPGLENDIDYEVFKLEQDSDTSLHQARKWAEIKKSRTNNNGYVTSFEVKEGLLYRTTVNKDGFRVKRDQLVVPKKFRNDVMKMGHETLMSGHLGITKSKNRIQRKFYWPGMYEDVRNFCKSCQKCQKTVLKGM